VSERASLRLLIVDDDPVIARLLAAVLTTEGFSAPRIVATGREALAAAPEADVVLLDHDLPDIMGTEVLRHLTTWSHPPSVVLVTAHGDETVAASALRHGADDYLVKDSDLTKQLPHVIERVRRLRALKDALAAAERDRLQAERLAAIGEMTVTLHHEINNPLMSAMMEVDILLSESGDLHGHRAALEGVKEALGRIRDIVKRVADLRAARSADYHAKVRMVDVDQSTAIIAPDHGPAVLYVRDEVLKRVVSSLLRQAGYQVQLGRTPEEAASLAAGMGVQLVVVQESSTPDSHPLGGFQPTAERPYKTVALVAGDGSDARAAGADHLIRLPFDPATFIDDINTALQV